MEVTLDGVVHQPANVDGTPESARVGTGSEDDPARSLPPCRALPGSTGERAPRGR
ncbi:MAG: hypothetical protein ACRCY8_19785 [Dermatophilaceae bacterium]